ncbi:DUF4336 domain-containing protein [Massilia cavernae]|uniref:DUF4336 domain-containing protein n=1 Tax=Massilia cavernae TaxID=2320864 RepID=A0A418XXU6_9BURK|nr:DUF4336 domain-containing protein [Massilia cavernae]RJG17741.1 DUF4336 domain-containing protein [Massilia cavernae]
MLQAIAPNLWHLQHEFTVFGIKVSTRMTVVRFEDGRLWLHSPVPLSQPVREQLTSLGTVAFIVAPSKTHHLFAGDAARAFPGAALYGARGLARKRPDLVGLNAIGPAIDPAWAHELEQVFIDGLPVCHESAWYHKASRTLILTDVCQWWTSEAGMVGRAYAMLTGVSSRLGVPRTVRRAIRDRDAFAASARAILAWPFERVVVAHDAIVDKDAHAAVERAFAGLAGGP